MIRSSILSVLAATAVSTAAFAGSVTLDVRDVDFTDPAQVDAVYDKIVVAAEKTCRQERLSLALSVLYRPMSMEECVAETVDRTVEDVELTILTQIHSARTAAASEYAAIE